jgi:hypothetical protein
MKERNNILKGLKEKIIFELHLKRGKSSNKIIGESLWVEKIK